MKKTLTTLFAVALFAGPSFAFALSEREGLDIYQRGLYLEAIDYWKKAAAAGDAGSAYRLSEEYFDAKIVKRDLKLALQYLKHAARMGMPAAMFNVASMLETGEGIMMDKVEAYKYYLLSRDQGFAPFANKALEEIAANMTADQIAEAEQRADDFIPQSY